MGGGGQAESITKPAREKQEELIVAIYLTRMPYSSLYQFEKEVQKLIFYATHQGHSRPQ